MKYDYRNILKKCRIGVPGAQSHEDDIVSSNFLTTMLCFVPLSQLEAFERGYENLVPDCILPRSAKRLDQGQDEKMAMFRVIIMTHKKDEFVLRARSDLRLDK